MKTMLHTLVVALALTIAPLSEAAMTTSEMKAAEAVGKQALTTYVAQVVNARNYEGFGFGSLEEARMARLGPAYQVMIMDLTAVAEFDPEKRLDTSLRDGGRLWYPVLVEDQIRTALELVRQKDQWIPGAFGGSREIQTVTTVRKELPQLLERSNVVAPYTVSVVQMPTLLATFLYIESSSGEYLVPAMIQPQRYDLENAKVYSVNDIMTVLKDHASRIERGLIR